MEKNLFRDFVDRLPETQEEKETREDRELQDRLDAMVGAFLTKRWPEGISFDISAEEFEWCRETMFKSYKHCCHLKVKMPFALFVLALIDWLLAEAPNPVIAMKTIFLFGISARHLECLGIQEQ